MTRFKSKEYRMEVVLADDGWTNLYDEAGTFIGCVEGHFTDPLVVETICKAWVDGHSMGMSKFQPNSSPDGLANKGIARTN